jgi:hypothetical protein
MTTGTSVHTPPSLQGSEEVLWQYGSWSPLHSQKFFLVTGSKLSYLRVKLFGGSIKSFANVSLYKLRFLSGRIHAGIKIISHIQYLQGKQESRQRWFKDPGGRAVGTGEGVDSLHGWPVHLSHIHSPMWRSCGQSPWLTGTPVSYPQSYVEKLWTVSMADRYTCLISTVLRGFRFAVWSYCMKYFKSSLAQAFCDWTFIDSCGSPFINHGVTCSLNGSWTCGVHCLTLWSRRNRDQ